MTSIRLGEEKAANGELPSLEITYEETRRRLEGQFEQIRGLDWKASLSLAAGSIVIAATAGLAPGPMLASLEKWVLLFAILAIFLSVAFAVTALFVRTYYRPPNPSRLRDYYIDERPEVTKLTIIDTTLEDIQRNERPISQKVKLVQFSYLCLAKGVLLLGLGVIFGAF